MVQQGRPQMAIGRMRTARWIPKVTNRHSEYVILTAFPLQQLLHELASMLRYTYFAGPFRTSHVALPPKVSVNILGISVRLSLILADASVVVRFI